MICTQCGHEERETSPKGVCTRCLDAQFHYGGDAPAPTTETWKCDWCNVDKEASEVRFIRDAGVIVMVRCRRSEDCINE